MSIKTPADVIAFAREKQVQFVDMRFTDLFGMWHHITVPVAELTEEFFEEGHGFDGSSVRAWKHIESSDMMLLPVAETAAIDPFIKAPTLVLICNVVEPGTHQPYERDPREIARRAEAFLNASGVADSAYFGPEAEFFIFDDIRFGSSMNESFYRVDSNEGIWNSGSRNGPNLGHRPGVKGGYFPCAPLDTQTDIRNDMVLAMQAVGIEIETHHHEVATAGQAEIDMRFDKMLAMADKTQWYKHCVKNVAFQHGKTATFMPKPIYDDNGSGMHCHQSLWKDGKPLFAGDGYAGLSQTALWYIGGLLKHARALCAFINPTTNSYRRLVPGFEAPNKLAYSCRNRSASIRIPTYNPSPKGTRLEFRTPDPSANPYLAFAAQLMAGLDGVLNRIDPGDPMDQNIYDLPPEEAANIPSAPGSLAEALDALEADHAWLTRGDVFTAETIAAFIAYKRSEEVDQMRLRPTPLEFELYYSI